MANADFLHVWQTKAGTKAEASAYGMTSKRGRARRDGRKLVFGGAVDVIDEGEGEGGAGGFERDGGEGASRVKSQRPVRPVRSTTRWPISSEAPAAMPTKLARRSMVVAREPLSQRLSLLGLAE